METSLFSEAEIAEASERFFALLAHLKSNEEIVKQGWYGSTAGLNLFRQEFDPFEKHYLEYPKKLESLQNVSCDPDNLSINVLLQQTALPTEIVSIINKKNAQTPSNVPQQKFWEEAIHLLDGKDVMEMAKVFGTSTPYILIAVVAIQGMCAKRPAANPTSRCAVAKQLLEPSFA